MTLQIAGVRIALHGLAPSLAAAARARYRPFVVDGGAAALTIELAPTPQGAHAPDGDPRVARAGDRRFTVGYGTLTAELDLAAGRGRAALAESVHVLDSLLRIALSLALVERGGLLLHGSSVALGDGALVCFGPSGVGKTTVARSVPAAAVLCDELTAVYPADGAGGARIVAAGTPFHGDLDVCAARVLPLRALCRLRHADRDALAPLGPAAAVRELLAATLFFCRDEALVLRLVDVAARIASVGTSVLEFTRHCHVPTFVGHHLRGHTLPRHPQAAGPNDGA